ncbi:unnamed protein product [Bemisia tabaci]|uniref:Uncharacterized protein n=1 Tax=Bemisia tabaci TaxID=7038 RepID=A0A9P0F0B4_BEMTA|nr:unnamed protein product [Bemisia tabaci]
MIVLFFAEESLRRDPPKWNADADKRVEHEREQPRIHKAMKKKLLTNGCVGIFVNRSLHLENIKFYGFDMDYTLAGKFLVHIIFNVSL